MRKFVLPASLVLAVILYLFWSYAYLYNHQKANFIPKPDYPGRQIVKGTAKGAPLKMAVLGDSLLSGTGSSDSSKSLPYLIAKSLAIYSGPDVVLINLSEPGKGVEDVLGRQVPLAVKEEPDYIVLLIGVNDIHNLMLAGYFKYSYSRILDELKATGAKITAVNIPYLGSDKIISFPWNLLLSWRTGQFNDIIKQLSDNREVKVVNLYGQFKGSFQKASNLYASDSFHPSDEGYALWASYINANLNR